MIDSYIHSTLNFFAALFIVAVGLLLLAIIALYLIDIRQTRHTLRRNYPVIGRFRYFFEHLGEFFRQYFFALDREEMPFDRATRSWVYRAAKGVTTSVAFGSTRRLDQVGDIHFASAGFALLDEHTQATEARVIGPHCQHPYAAPSFLNISGMSFGALSAPAITALSKGAAKANCWLNTGEGGLSPYHLAGNCDIVFQIGTAKYGVRDEEGNLCPKALKSLADKPQVRMFELKLSQGAKPGKGGILPAAKVSEEIAATRGIPAGQASISPNRHRDIENLQELIDRLDDIRDITGKPVGFKAVLGDTQWFTDLCAYMAKLPSEQVPDFITLDGAEGGTGASPQALMDHMGLPLMESLPFVVDELKRFGLRERIAVIASGKLITPSKAARAMATGADFVVSARGFMFSLGCIQAMQCHQNTCPTGITTHNARLQKGLDPQDKANRVANYHQHLVEEIEMIAHSCGAAHARKLSRRHVRIINETGRSTLLSEAYPEPIKHVSDTH
ncbi:MAG TPA: FMN-binding glutamate synthase family protein [Marinagarivorans sp.]